MLLRRAGNKLEDTCRAALAFDVTITKPGAAPAHFDALVERLQDVPALPTAQIAQVVALVDSYRRVRTRIDWPEEGNPRVPHHLRMSSSDGRKGRLLAAAVGTFQPKQVLEIGTAYGVSAAFMLATTPDVTVTTVETWEPMKSLSRERLERFYPGRVRCVHEPIEEWLPGSDARFDMVFHDGWHSGDAYRRDFNTLLPTIAPGGLVVLDDITWTDDDAYGAWQEIAALPNVKVAAELDREIGLLLF